MLRVACAIVVHEGRVLCALRGPGMSPSGVWEFPGGKVEADESDAECIVRELKEELHITVAVLHQGPAVTHPLPDGRELRLVPLVCHWVAGEPQLTEHAEIRWCNAAEMQTLDWAAADWGILAWWEKAGDRFLT